MRRRGGGHPWPDGLLQEGSEAPLAGSLLQGPHPHLLRLGRLPVPRLRVAEAVHPDQEPEEAASKLA